MKTASKKRFDAQPGPSLRLVKSSSRLRRVSFPTEKFELAELVFDSARQAPGAGVRSSAAIARQLLYKAGSVCIDMYMEPKPGSDSVVLIGQLLDSKRPDHGIKDIPVRLLCEGDTISRNKTNHVGEFEFGIGAHHHLQLAFGMSGRRTLIVPVPDTKAEPERAIIQAALYTSSPRSDSPSALLRRGRSSVTKVTYYAVTPAG